MDQEKERQRTELSLLPPSSPCPLRDKPPAATAAPARSSAQQIDPSSPSEPAVQFSSVHSVGIPLDPDSDDAKTLSGSVPKSSPEHDDNRQKKIPGNAQAQRIAKVSNGASKVLDLIYKGCTQLSDMDVLKYLTWMSQLSDIFPNRCILSLIQTVRLLFSALIHTLLDPLSVLPSLVIFPPAAQTTRGFFTRFFSQISHRDIHRLCHSTSIPPLPISRLLLLIYKLVRLL